MLIPYNNITNVPLTSSKDVNKGELSWKDNYVFSDTLKFIGKGKGYKNLCFEFEDSLDRRYQMFLNDFCEMVNDVVIEQGEVEGKWTFVKRDYEFGIKLVK